MICPVCATVFTPKWNATGAACSRRCAGSLPKRAKVGVAMSASAIAARLGITTQAVQQAEWRGLRKLRRALEAQGIFNSGVVPRGHHLTTES